MPCALVGAHGVNQHVTLGSLEDRDQIKYRHITLKNVSRFEKVILVNGLVYTRPRPRHPLSVALMPCAIA